MLNATTTVIQNLQLQSEKVRKRLVEIIYASKSGHIGGSLSSVEIETALYFHFMNIDPKNPQKDDRDRFILSKGHSVEALYSVLAAAGFIDDALLNTYGKFNSMLAGHPIKKIPGIELNSGALGHGLSVGVGLSIAAKRDKKGYKTYVLMGDGEQGEGSIYEAAMSASHYKLDNLVAIIDRNQLQISGSTEDVMSLEPMRERWESFGWEVFDMEGNDMEDIINTFANINYNNSKPKLIIAHTTKGCGITFMEKVAKWHHGIPNEEQYKEAIAEIEERINNLRG
ncbi:transketolase [Microbacter margulisiae]|uniref:Transketolase n=1 Tax=Microbacter margulisiae TaxID=1350067 RepID=A0A7W5DTF0_9PORP|nr:transketolase [Microbacter margulisiae]MBB3188757.1 transketolase [Microbacter margulisiae]